MTPDQFWRANLNAPPSPVRRPAKKVAVEDEVVSSDLPFENPDEKEIDRYLEWLESTL
jgi:hypothetical protein